ncbi:MAG: hypothetical protein V4585_17290 [Bacteroidota bacterium]
MVLKNYIALFLLALISVKTLLVPVVYLDFELRKDYIIQNLCENRFKPQLKCNGQCYLAKKLHKIAEENATKQTEKQGQTIKKILEEVFETTSVLSCDLAFNVIVLKSTFFYKLPNYHNFTTPLFHPPCFA